jgi:hypothetical protein
MGPETLERIVGEDHVEQALKTGVVRTKQFCYEVIPAE